MARCPNSRCRPGSSARTWSWPEFWFPWPSVSDGVEAAQVDTRSGEAEVESDTGAPDADAANPTIANRRWRVDNSRFADRFRKKSYGSCDLIRRFGIDEYLI